MEEQNKPAAEEQQNPTTTQPNPTVEEPKNQSAAEETWKKWMQTPDTTDDYDSQDIEPNKLMAVLCYLNILFFIPLFCSKSRFVRFHLNQGIVLFVVSALLALLGSITSGFLNLVFALLSFGCLLLCVWGIVNAAKGLARELPIVGKFKILH